MNWEEQYFIQCFIFELTSMLQAQKTETRDLKNNVTMYFKPKYSS